MSPQPSGARPRPLVLVVDDLVINVEVLEAKLSKEGFDTVHAFSGPSALEAAERELPDLVLLDAMMPEMDGLEVCRRLKGNPKTAQIPVIVLTALSGSEDRWQAFAAGANDFLTKPFRDDVLLTRVHFMLRRKG